MNTPVFSVNPLACAASADHLPVRFEDRSMNPRFGCKGKGAAAWLAEQGWPVPEHANQWQGIAHCEAGGFVARLGRAEFLVEGNTTAIGRLAEAELPGDVIGVLRQDANLRLSGPGLPELLRQTCNVDFAALDLATCPVVLTSLAGVAVIALPEEDGIRLWCDGTYGPWLWETLQEVAGGL
ncbi:MAG: hypothetical protein LBL69_04820 [Zoogloeaceae bacterium]|jgi:sarcosine oxidase subunit gamma|nr:hypothetical protein [Zoogloeaceae bacterium]